MPFLFMRRTYAAVPPSVLEKSPHRGPKAAIWPREPFPQAGKIRATSGIDERDLDSAAHQAPQVTGRFTERRKRPTPPPGARAERCRARAEARGGARAPRVTTRGTQL